MGELILLRHAHAEPAAAGQADRMRPLSAAGRAEAAAAAGWLRARGLFPERALCSPARRARETAAIVTAALGGVAVVEEAAIYEATPGVLAGVVERHGDVDCLLLVGHNPGCAQLAGLLCGGHPPALPTAGIVAVRLPAAAGASLGAATPIACWPP